MEMNVYDVDAEIRAQNDQFDSLQQKCLLSFQEFSLKNVMHVEPDASKYLQVVFFYTALWCLCINLELSGARNNCDLWFVYIGYYACPHMEFLEANASDPESGDGECDGNERHSASKRNESPLSESAVRQVHLVTYSQADLEKFPSRRSFAEAVVCSFNGANANILQWVCCREPHKN